MCSPMDRPLFEVCRLLLGQELLVGQLVGPLHGRDGAKVPHALEIRCSPRRPGRRRVVRRLGRRTAWRQDNDGNRRADDSETSMAHDPPRLMNQDATPCKERHREGMIARPSRNRALRLPIKRTKMTEL